MAVIVTERGVSLEAIGQRLNQVRAEVYQHRYGGLGIVVPADLTFDHLIPVVRLGPWAPWNLMVAHDRCNKRRHTKPVLAEETRDAAEAYIAAKLASHAEEAAA